MKEFVLIQFIPKFIRNIPMILFYISSNENYDFSSMHTKVLNMQTRYIWFGAKVNPITWQFEFVGDR